MLRRLLFSLVGLLVSASAYAQCSPPIKLYPSTGDVQVYCGSTLGMVWGSPAGGGGGGGLSSVGIAVPPDESVVNSPLTGSGGTITITRNSQLSNLFLASPPTTAGIPSFRALSLSDMPGAFLQAPNNLSDIVNPATARTNLGLGSAAVQPASNFLGVFNNLSDLNNVPTARSNLGLGTAAVKNATGSGASVASVTGTFTAGDCVKFADGSGTIQDAGAACGSGGTGAVNSVTSNSSNLTFSPTTGNVIGTISTPTRPQTTTADTLVNTDGGKLVLENNAAGVAVTLPTVGTAGFGAGFGTSILNDNATGQVSVTSTSLINGASTARLNPFWSLWPVSDGTTYQSILIPSPTGQDSVAAHAGGGQASATAVWATVNNVTIVTTAGDSVKLPPAFGGEQIVLTDSGANAMQVFGTGSDTINGAAAATGVSQANTCTVQYNSPAVGKWFSTILGCSPGTGTVNSATAGQMAYYAATGTAVSGNPNATISSGALTLGSAGTVLGSLGLSGNTSGVVTIQPQAAAGTYNFNLPTSAGSSGAPLLSGGGGASPQTYGTLGAAFGGTGATTLAAHGVLVGEGTSPVVSLGACATGQLIMGQGASADPTCATTLSGSYTFSATNTFQKAVYNTVTTLTDGVTVTPDFSAGNYFTWTLGAAGRTLANPTNITAGQAIMLELVQDATGGRTITTYGTNWKFPGGTKPTLSTAANAIDAFSCWVPDTAHILCQAVTNFQ